MWADYRNQKSKHVYDVRTLNNKLQQTGVSMSNVRNDLDTFEEPSEAMFEITYEYANIDLRFIQCSEWAD
ncbi:unnamed protein product [Parnassius apollo]|uniref:(apollo) hypothetical protein n=1 Tax=Parnassius apollo TaxID=110799 RepID=A0A8S3W8B2_PARAO|nr:unnamed protein product [Parnassius apollo]